MKNGKGENGMDKSLEKVISYATIGIVSAVLGVAQQFFTEKDIAREVHDQLEEVMKNVGK